ncbi:hypothetical protein CO540_18625 [Micromonospora sp. WMMA2032]|uniref:hypothetical protein n=1 Tax=Micromonospora TaxID=1873 RepID=UPI000C05A419|nr:hypothetical protein [Micromonospora sp. WMMA2032]ATO15603.1 hypothetical protein CO540_18625 [Micromonospora sp. WMMA2032]
MRALVGLLVVIAVLMIGAFVLVARRDRARLSGPEDTAAARAARLEQERHTAERHGVQSEVWRRGQTPQ